MSLSRIRRPFAIIDTIFDTILECCEVCLLLLMPAVLKFLDLIYGRAELQTFGVVWAIELVNRGRKREGVNRRVWDG